MHRLRGTRGAVRIPGGRQVKVRTRLTAAGSIPLTKTLPHSFDAASIAILDRLDALETLFRAVVPETASAPSQRAVDPQRPLDTTPQSPDFVLYAAPVFGEVYRVNVEAVLDWPGIAPAAHAQPRSLAAIYQPGRRHSEAEDAGSRRLLTLELDGETSRSLLRSFLQNFHVYNPVLEIAEVEDHVKCMLYNGPGWDARSCISVSGQPPGPHADIELGGS